MIHVTSFSRFAAVLAFACSLAGCNDDSRTAAVVEWNEFASELIAGNQLLPPVQTRALAIVQIAVHDALNSIEPHYETYVYHGEAQHASARASVSAATAAATRAALLAVLPAAAAPQIEARYATALESIPENNSKQAGIAVGEAAASAVVQLRADDGFAAALTKPYAPREAAPGVYQLTPPLNVVFVAGWNALPPFALDSGSQFRSVEPLLVSSSAYAQEYAEVKALGVDAGSERTETQTETARFWYDAATREWHSAARQGLAVAHHDVWDAAHVLATLSIAMADAVIASMDTKFHFEFWRPITAIRAGELDGNAATAGDPNWSPLCVTPPFPEYNSTHAATAGAAAEVLARTLGDAHTVVIDSPSLAGERRTFNSFSAAANDEGVSRIYCGIHFRSSMDAGLEQGRQVADFVLDTKLTRKVR